MRINGYNISPCEHEVWRAIAMGESSKEIAHRQGKSTKTVESQRHNLMAKIRAKCSADITRLAVRYGVIVVAIAVPQPVPEYMEGR